ncbi:MAG: hypothetical protein ABIG92_05825 [Candidatus Omnitrophota bacterium]
MLVLSRLIALVITGMGIALLAKPELLKKIISFVGEGKMVYKCAAIRIAAGTILLMASTKSKIPIIVVVIGIMALLKGVLAFVVGPEKVKSILKWCEGKPQSFVRIMAVIAVLIGLLLFNSI